MLISFFQSIRLDGQNFFTAPVSLLFLFGDKWHGAKLSLQFCLCHIQTKRYLLVGCLGGFSKSPHPPSLGQYSLHINIPIDGLTAELLGLYQQEAVFRNQIMSPKHQILGGFPLSGRGINIPAKEPGTGRLHQKLPVFVFPYGLIGSRQIGNNGSTHHCMVGSWRIGHPQILTYLTAYGQTMHGFTLKQNICAEGNGLSP